MLHSFCWGLDLFLPLFLSLWCFQLVQVINQPDAVWSYNQMWTYSEEWGAYYGGSWAFDLSLLFLSHHCGRGRGYDRSHPLRASTECRTKDRRVHEREFQREPMARSAEWKLKWSEWLTCDFGHLD